MNEGIPAEVLNRSHEAMLESVRKWTAAMMAEEEARLEVHRLFGPEHIVFEERMAELERRIASMEAETEGSANGR